MTEPEDLNNGEEYKMVEDQYQNLLSAVVTTEGSEMGRSPLMNNSSRRPVSY